MSCSMPSFKQVAEWFDQRLAISQLRAIAEKKKVPGHENAGWYYLGGIALVFLLVQVVTGILLMFYYIPEIGSAHASILNINTKIAFGWFIRSLHSWAANLMILAVVIHLVSTFFMKAYRSPRELTWMTGMGLLILTMGFGFTGYLLPWDQIAFFATKIGLDITSKMPVMGEFMANLLRGGADIGQVTLSRFFVIHVFVLPLALLGLLGIHLWLIQTQGISEPESFQNQPPEKKKYEHFFPDFALKDVMIWLLVINVLAACATLAPWGLGEEADPIAPAPVGIKPEWYFLAMFQFLKYLPAHIGPFEGEMVGVLLFGLIALAMVLLPFIDRGKNQTLASLVKTVGLVILVLFIVFTLWGMMS